MKTILSIVVAAVLVWGGVGAVMLQPAWAAEGGKAADKPKDGEAKKGGDAGKEGAGNPQVHGVPGGPLFYDLPDILVNLDTGSQKPAYLKVSVSLQIAKELDATFIQGFLPRILDDFTLYLRELRPESLKNPKSLDRLRQELLQRVIIDVKPIKVSDILFREFLIQ